MWVNGLDVLGATNMRRESMQSSRWTRLKATDVWQAAFVRPFEDKKNWKKAVGALLAYAFGLVLIAAPITELINNSRIRPHRPRI
jgi:hypothetical protein